MNREDFFEKLDDFDMDAFGKDDSYDNSDVYQVIQFFANKIYDDFEYMTCENCKYYKPSHKSYKYAVCDEIGNTTVPYDFGCKRWEEK